MDINGIINQYVLVCSNILQRQVLPWKEIEPDAGVNLMAFDMRFRSTLSGFIGVDMVGLIGEVGTGVGLIGVCDID
jgi:hypothetical protein